MGRVLSGEGAWAVATSKPARWCGGKAHTMECPARQRTVRMCANSEKESRHACMFLRQAGHPPFVGGKAEGVM